MIQSVKKVKRRSNVEKKQISEKKHDVVKKEEKRQSISVNAAKSEVTESYRTEDERMILWRQNIVSTNSEMVSRFGTQQLQVTDKKIADDISLVNSLAEAYKQMGSLYDVVPSVVSVMPVDEINTIQLFRSYSETNTSDVREEIQESEDEAPEGFEML